MARTVKIHLRTRRGTALTSPFVLIGLAVVMALLGTLLLWLPISSTDESNTSLMSALFSAVSAVTVTGLVVVDTGVHWSAFGQMVLLVLVFLGGLGFITGFAFLISLARQHIGLQGRLALSGDIGSEAAGDLVRYVRNIVVAAVAIQVGAFILILIDFTFIGGLWEGASFGEKIWHALFQAVSGFNNAGLDILPEDMRGGSLSGLTANYLTIGVTMVIIVLGGLSFPVLFDVARHWRFNRFTLDTKLVLVGSLALLVGGMLLFMLLEWSNPDTLGNRPIPARILGALFESATTRSAGLTTISQAHTTPATTAITMVLMFIGGAAVTSAGGVKVNVLMVALFTVLATFRPYRAVTAFKRSIPDDVVNRALVVLLFVLGLFALTTVALLVAQPPDPERGLTAVNIAFEAFSAIGTVGLSKGITSSLNIGAQAVVVVAMLLGRFGPIMVALIHLNQKGRVPYRYPSARVRIG